MGRWGCLKSMPSAEALRLWHIALQIPMPSLLSAEEIRMSLFIRQVKAIESRTYQQEAERLSSFLPANYSRLLRPSKERKARPDHESERRKGGNKPPLFVLSSLLREFDGKY